MKISAQGLQLLIDREGSKNRAYRDSVGVLTIGIGHAGPDVYEGLIWTDDQIKSALAKDISRFEKAINDGVKVGLKQHQYDALVSFAFNVGEGAFKTSTLLKKINAGDFEGAALQFNRWNIPPEIISRRNGEREQFRGARFAARIP
ncbi:MAG: lysozyme [Elstera sp.]